MRKTGVDTPTTWWERQERVVVEEEEKKIVKRKREREDREGRGDDVWEWMKRSGL